MYTQLSHSGKRGVCVYICIVLNSDRRKYLCTQLSHHHVVGFLCIYRHLQPSLGVYVYVYMLAHIHLVLLNLSSQQDCGVCVHMYI